MEVESERAWLESKREKVYKEIVLCPVSDMKERDREREREREKERENVRE